MLKNQINSALRLLNLRLIKTNHNIDISKDLGYIPAKETVKSAENEGLSVCDYVEKIWNQKGETQKVVDNMEKLGVFQNFNPTVCEIGAGTGRYIEKVIEKCNPKRYESYEIAADWSEWLEKEYDIISQPTGGFSLSSTSDNSIDIVHAHGVFVYLKFLDNIRYFNEMIRVIKLGGIIILIVILKNV